MKTLEEKAEEYTNSVDTRIFGSEETLDATSLMQHAYLAGAKETLAGQWRSVEDEMPPRGKDVLICTDKRQIKMSCWQGTNPDDETHRHRYWKWWGNMTPYVLFWMPIPEPPKPEVK